MPLKKFSELGLQGISLIFITHAILSLIIFPHLLIKHQIPKFSWPVFGIALAGGLGIFSFTYALMYGDVVRVMVLFYLLPIWGVIGGRIFLREYLGLQRWAGVVIALIGAYLILGGHQIFDSPPTWIDGLALLSGMSFAANNILFRGGLHLALPSKLFAMFVGCSTISGVFLLSGLEAVPFSVGASSWLWLLLYTFTWLLFANIGSQWAIERMEAGRSSIIIIVQLVAAVLSATFIGGESLSLFEWLGCLMVLSAAVLEARGSLKRL